MAMAQNSGQGWWINGSCARTHRIWSMMWFDIYCIYIYIYDMIWYDMILYDIIWYDIIWYDMIWYDMIWYNMWCDVIWYYIWYLIYDIWYDMTWYLQYILAVIFCPRMPVNGKLSRFPKFQGPGFHVKRQETIASNISEIHYLWPS